MPLFIQFLMIVVPPVLAVIALRVVLRRTLTPNVVDNAEKVVPFILGSFGGFFGLVAGFMLSNSWVELRALRSAMMAEVNAVADLEDIAATLPTPHDEELKQAIYQYLNAVLDRELPLMAQGRVSPTTTAALTELWVPLAQFHAVS